MTYGYNVNLIQIDEQLEERDENARLSLVARGEQGVKKLLDARNWAEAAMAVAQQAQEQHDNRHRQPAVQFRVGDIVWINMKNINTDRPSKMLDRTITKYTVTYMIITTLYELY